MNGFYMKPSASDTTDEISDSSYGSTDSETTSQLTYSYV